ncbi:DNA cytosine methyltransferase [Nitrosovibrio sp. Nv6]|uniref:DNA cytosine methyltransferase n=1 Tax=Nitrosovibrio sp. Nv6 TaxID=1855340 RepID=UPI0008C7F562|nr:DNA cytosine methyltransferase [Nitrosovibrio sp. Nv6]SEP43323.1 Site-specific DNA-cytosine methylase [Nitrosovibrio sp. Nv6]
MKRDVFTGVSDDVREIRHFHLFCGLGGGAKGFNRATPRVGNLVGKFRCIGGIDINAPAIRDFERFASVKGTVLDLFDRDQYFDFHGTEPPSSWREATPADIQAAAGNERPHIVFLSAPCKGFSGLLSENRSRTAKYQALNRLTLRGVWLMMEAFDNDPPELIVFENVPRIANRGRPLLDQIGQLLRTYGYAVAETTHDCGELGGLAQSRKRFLLVARHIERVPPFLYEPDKKRLQNVGSVLGRMPLPGDATGGPLHRIPALQWKTWVRLAFVEAGSDWRSLNRFTVQDGHLRDYLIAPEYRGGYLGVHHWHDNCGTVQGQSLPSNGAFSIADPRFAAGGEYGQLGVRDWNESTGTVTGQRSPIQGSFSVADPRMPDSSKRQNGIYRVIAWNKQAGSVTGANHVAGAAMSIADPRGSGFAGKYTTTPYDAPAGTVISGSTTGTGAFSVADPRPGNIPKKGDHYLTGGHYGIVQWDKPCGAIAGAAGHDNGRWSVADPRLQLPAAEDRLVARIIAEDGTWHRPFTTLELAALQSLIDPEEYLELDGLSDSNWRERIGNAVPPDAATAIANVMGTTLLLAWSGETFILSAAPIWVQPVAIALALP